MEKYALALGDKVVELSNNYCALGKRTNSVYYFGEDKGGAWLSGEKGAKFGLLMPGLPLVGASSRTRHWRFPTGRSSSAPSAASGASARRGDPVGIRNGCAASHRLLSGATRGKYSGP